MMVCSFPLLLLLLWLVYGGALLPRLEAAAQLIGRSKRTVVYSAVPAGVRVQTPLTAEPCCVLANQEAVAVLCFCNITCLLVVQQ